IENGKFTKSQNVHELLKSLEGKNITLVVYEGERRTLAMNALFHKLLTEWGKHLGYNLSEMKCLVKTELGLYRVAKNNRTNEEFMVYESSKNWDKKKFAEVIDWIYRTADSTGFIMESSEDFKQRKAI